MKKLFPNSDYFDVKKFMFYTDCRFTVFLKFLFDIALVKV